MAPPPYPETWVDRWIGPAGRPVGPQESRQAAVVVLGGLIALGAFAVLTLALTVGAAPIAPRVQSGMAAVAVAVALGMVRWRGWVEPAAWILTLTVALTPILQSAFDAGIRDPVLGMIALAPIAGAMASGTRLAIANAAVGILGAAVLFVLHIGGLAPEPFSAPETLAGYSLAVASGGAVVSALAGVLYVRYTHKALSAAEGQSTRLDAALQASETRYRSLFNNIPVGMYRTAPDGRVLLANLAMARMLGAESPEAATELNANAFYDDPYERDRFRSLIGRTGAIRRFEARWRRPSGGVRYVRIDARMARDASGQPLYFEGVVEDVTAEREAREALFRNEAWFRALVQRSSDVVVVVDRGSRVTYVSPSVAQLLGHAPEAVLGSDALNLVHPDDRPRTQAVLDESHGGTATATQVDVRLRHADGHYVFVEGVGTALYDDPAVGGLVLNLRDVTERKRAQAVLVEAKRQAEEVARLKSTFLANMSHEVRTPLTAILGFADVLAEEVEDGHQKEFVDLIARSGRRLMDTLNSVLDLARLEAGHGGLSEERVDVGALVAEAVGMFRPAAAERGIAITASVSAPPGALDAILDEPALVRVLHNLIGNALKFTERGGIAVVARPNPSGPSVVIEVQDTGIGIDASFLPRLFSEFEQESSGVERTHEGTGLGLAISRQLVERMGGTIDVRSEKGVGTTFTVTFPAAEAAPDAADTRPLVLVVDDNDQACDVAARVLAERFRVTVAHDGEDALAAAARERPDAAVLDIHLGQSITGEDVMRHLRQTPAFTDLPVIAVTAYALPGDRARFLAAGFDAFVTKPYAREDLLRALDAAFRKRRRSHAEPPSALFAP